MADNLNIYQFCNKCKGTGEVPELAGQDGNNNPIYETKICDDCNGEKESLWGQMREEEAE